MTMARIRALIGALFALATLAWAPSALGHPEACDKDAGPSDEAYCYSDDEIAAFDDSGATLAVDQLA